MILWWSQGRVYPSDAPQHLITLTQEESPFECRFCSQKFLKMVLPLLNINIVNNFSIIQSLGLFCLSPLLLHCLREHNFHIFHSDEFAFSCIFRSMFFTLFLCMCISLYPEKNIQDSFQQFIYFFGKFSISLTNCLICICKYRVSTKKGSFTLEGPNLP